MILQRSADAAVLRLWILDDCGLLEVLADPGHEEHESMLEWVGGAFDADRFDLVAVSEALSLVAAR